MPSIADTIQWTNISLAAFHSDLPALLNIEQRSPNSRFVTHGKLQAIQELLDNLIHDRRTKIGVIGDMEFLYSLLSFSGAKKFQEVHLIDDDRTISYYAQSFGIQQPLNTATLQGHSIDAIIIDSACQSPTLQSFERLTEKGSYAVYFFDPGEHINRHRQQIAEQIAEQINALQPEVLYVGQYAYFNLCKQSMAIRKMGRKTALLIQVAKNRLFKEKYFDAMFTSYDDDILFCHILNLLEVPLVHVQGCMTLSHIPLMIKAAAKKSKVICEFNDLSSLFTTWESFDKLWGEKATQLEHISEELLFDRMDGLIFNHDIVSIKGVMEKYGSTLPKIEFHTYPVADFFAPPPVAPKKQSPSKEIHLAFIGSLNSSNLPKEFFGDVQVLQLIKRLVQQKLHFDIFLLPYIPKNKTLWDYTFFEKGTPYFNIKDGLPPDKIPHELTHYDYGVMFYPFDRDLQVLPDHLKGIFPSKFSTFLEACLPIIVSEELSFVAKIVKKYNLGIVISQEDIATLPDILATANRTEFIKNIRQYRNNNMMELHIKRMTQFYDQILTGDPLKSVQHSKSDEV